MDVLKIKYCNNFGYLIKNNRSKYNILKNINNIIEYNILDKNFKIYSDRFEYILKNQHTEVTYLSSGKEVFLYLTKINGENISLIIEKDINPSNLYPKIIAIKLSLSSELYNNTLLSAELYKIKDNWFLLLDTLLIFKNIKTRYRNKNNNKIISNILKSYDFKPIDACKIIKKIYFSPNYIETFLETTNIRLKGLKFINNYPIHFYFHKKFICYDNGKKIHTLPENSDRYIRDRERDLIKMKNTNIYVSKKRETEETFFLKLKKSNTYGIYDLFDLADKYVGLARIETIEISVDVINRLKMGGDIKVAVKYNFYFDKFQIVHVGTTKTISTRKDIIKVIS